MEDLSPTTAPCLSTLLNERHLWLVFGQVKIVEGFPICKDEKHIIFPYSFEEKNLGSVLFLQ